VDLRELNKILECMDSHYPVNDKLMDRICIKKRRKGKKSLCFGVSELEKVKLKMNDNIIVNSFDENPNSVIVKGDLRPYEKADIDKYRDRGNELTI
jgi:hypothetical protein